MTVTFVRAPMQDTREQVIDYLQARGCEEPFRDVHRGPDGSWRGSGVTGRTVIEDMAAYETIEEGERP